MKCLQDRAEGSHPSRSGYIMLSPSSRDGRLQTLWGGVNKTDQNCLYNILYFGTWTGDYSFIMTFVTGGSNNFDAK